MKSKIDSPAQASFIKIIMGVIVIAAIAISCYGIDSKKVVAKKPTTTTESKGFAVVELFTSEGCSSCPPADELVKKILSEKRQDVYIVSFHVDYWNRLGWKDEFSRAAFSDRQKQYARHLSLESIYTPQIVVNGSDQFTGSDETKLRNSLNNTKETSKLIIEASRTNNSILRVSYKIPGNHSNLLNIALVQPEAVTDVKRGENSGRELHHVNIVREFKTAETAGDTGIVDVQIPKELMQIPFELIAYTQNKNDFKINGAAETQVPAGIGRQQLNNKR